MPVEPMDLVLEAVRDVRKGVETLHGKVDKLDDRIHGLAHATEIKVDTLRGEVAHVRDEHAETAEKVARLEGFAEGRDMAVGVGVTFGAEPPTNGTGRHRQPSPSQSDIVIPTPAPGTTIEFSMDTRKHRSLSPPAIFGWIAKTAGSKAGRVIGAALAATALTSGGAWLHSLFAPTQTRVVTVTTPAPAPAQDADAGAGRPR